ncbi:MAG: 3-oxoacyl-ACP reductase FabG [Calditrichaeota bacterium]|nr:MAG: 3-oxoacyl-ACP reductase FabG [Calditrichota bacterium]
MNSLHDKIAIVTGASRGIGKAIAVRLAAAGAKVILTATSQDGADKTATEVNKSGGDAVAKVLNLSNPTEIAEFISSVHKEFGRIDILVNNAGITRDNLLIRMSPEQWQEVIDVNLSGVYYAIRAAAKPMMRQRKGKIINITSIVGQIGNAGQVNYSAAKAGIIGMSKSVAKELAARNVQVNCVAPGFIETDMTKDLPEDVKTDLVAAIPAGRMGAAEDVANAVAFLASDETDYITGQVINVDGGMVM